MTIKTILATTALAATLVAGGAAVADAAPQRQKRPAAEAAETMARRFVPRAVHAEFVVKAKEGGYETIEIDRGELTKVAGITLHIHRPDGVDVTVKLTDSTRFRGIENADGLQEGKPIVVVSKAGNAISVAQRPAKS